MCGKWVTIFVAFRLCPFFAVVPFLLSKHGVRSLQAILKMAIVAFETDPSQTLQLSSIASRDQLAMHVENVDVF
jgi:hypothetical protein